MHGQNLTSQNAPEATLSDPGEVLLPSKIPLFVLLGQAHWRTGLFCAIVLLSILMGLAQSRLQYLDSHYVRSVAWGNVIRRDEYDDYYTLSLRRLGLYPAISRIKVNLGSLIYWTENPHALQALGWFLLALALTITFLALKVGRVCVRHYLHRRGWIH